MCDVYSYHTFLFPFLWNCRGNKSAEDFMKVLSVGERWVEIFWRDGKIPTDGSKEKWMQDYAAYQYFTESANAAIFNVRNDNVVRCFEYRHKGQPVNHRGKYTIIKHSGEHQINVSLNINNIRLNIYNTGVAIMVLELENTTHKSIDDVNKINEFGRRINMPFFSLPDVHTLCADKIEISFDSETSASEEYYDTLTKLENDFSTEQAKISIDSIMRPLQMLLDGNGKDNGGYEVTTKSAHESETKLYIKPCIDDRMFVCCVVLDAQLSDEIKGIDTTEEYSFLEGWDKRLEIILEINKKIKAVDACGGQHSDYMRGFADETYLSNRLYKLLFIENEVTCQNTRMKRELLCDSIYRRWLDAGTLHAVTHHSIVCVVSPDCYPAMVLNPFLTEYVQLATLVLAQRATILALSGEIATVADKIRGGSGHITTEQIDAIENVQAKYVAAQSQLFISEATVQEQGVGIYQMMQEQMYILTNKAELDAQMNNLRDVSEIYNDRLERHADVTLNKNLSWLSLIALVVAVIQVVPLFFDAEVTPLINALSGGIAAIALIVGVVLLRETLFSRKCRARKNKNK